MLRISNLSFSYSSRPIFSQANLILPDFGIVAVIGDNASGKTTLLKLLRGELTPDDGTIKVDGDLAYLPQSNDLPPDKSGGERTRLALAQIFAERANVILLDEPTNNLDQTSKDWLRDRLLTFNGLVLLVSHDRDFINQIADYVLVVKDQTLQLYRGNYDDYCMRLSQNYHEQQLYYEQAQKAVAKVTRRLHDARTRSDQTNHSHFNKFRDENRMAFRGKRSHAQGAAGKIIHNCKTELEHLRSVEKPQTRKTYQAKISADFLHRRRLLTVDNLAKIYNQRVVFQDVNFEIYTSERFRVIGNNGTGKTTLFQIILGKTQPDQGFVKLSPEIKLGYISQDIFGLNLDQSFLAQHDTNITETFRAASTMDLTSQDLKTTCNKLSRGQLTKLAFLKVMLMPVDLLILDEPTNHLDIRARENIENALKDYRGAILLATHDEKFAENCRIDNFITLTK